MSILPRYRSMQRHVNAVTSVYSLLTLTIHISIIPSESPAFIVERWGDNDPIVLGSVNHIKIVEKVEVADGPPSCSKSVSDRIRIRREKLEETLQN